MSVSVSVSVCHKEKRPIDKNRVVDMDKDMQIYGNRIVTQKLTLN